MDVSAAPPNISGIWYRPYESELDLPSVMTLVGSELSEPYVIYTYRYFLVNWPHLAFLAFPPLNGLLNDDHSIEPVGVIVCKQDIHKSKVNRGYIAMLSVNKAWRKRGIARALVQRSASIMKTQGAKEIVLETEFDNSVALAFYASMGFMREKRLFRFYMNGKDAFRLVLPIDDDDDDRASLEVLLGDAAPKTVTPDLVDATLAPSLQALTT